MKLNAKQSLLMVELVTLPAGSVFGHDGSFWIRTDTQTAGYITCVNLCNGSTDGYRPNAKVIPQPDAEVTGLTF